MQKETFQKISYGLYIISSLNDSKLNGQIANTVFQITSQPPTFAISINKLNLTHTFIENSKVFTISILSEETPMPLIGLFGFKSGRDIDKFKDINYKIGKNNAPIVMDNSIGYIECKVVNSIDAGTHTIFIGEVIDANIISDGKPLTYEYYHEIKNGKSPETAPTYLDIKSEKEVNKMDKYICKVCGYIYDPEVGDPDSGIKPGTSFETLPDDWVCPICGAGKDQFEKES